MRLTAKADDFFRLLREHFLRGDDLLAAGRKWEYVWYSFLFHLSPVN